MYLYCEDHSDADFTALVQRFGSPGEVANDFLSELGGRVVTKSKAIKRRFLYSVAVIIVFLVACIGIHTYYVQHKLLDGEYIESITYEEATNPYATTPTGWIVEFESNENEEYNSTAPNK